VVTGRVISVSIPPEQEAGRDAGRAPFRPPGEHDAHWREAVIAIQDVHKGEHGEKTLTIRFPASDDRVWYHAPKLHPGDEGHFVLHRMRYGGTGSAARSGAGGQDGEAGEEYYCVMHAGDFQPMHQPEGIKTLIASGAAPGKS